MAHSIVVVWPETCAPSAATAMANAVEQARRLMFMRETLTERAGTEARCEEEAEDAESPSVQLCAPASSAISSCFCFFMLCERGFAGSVDGAAGEPTSA